MVMINEAKGPVSPKAGLRLGEEVLPQAGTQVSSRSNLKAGQHVTVADRPDAKPLTDAGALIPEFADSGKVAEQALYGQVRALQFKGSAGASASYGSKQKAGATAASKLVGLPLGTNRDGQEVSVKREVGATQGYDDRLQAIAVARLGRAEPAAVIQDKAGKWHAVEVTANFYSGRFTSFDNDTRALYGLPSSAGIAKAQENVASLIKRLEELDTMLKNGGNARQIGEKQSETKKDLSQARVHLASLVFGVPETEIQFNTYVSGRTPGKINISASRDLNSPSATHGPVAGQGGVDFQPGMRTAFEIDLKELDDPTSAQLAMFHEVVHQRDYDFAQQWVKNYQDETRRIFVGGPAGRKPFENWINAQVPKRLTKADAELIVDQAADRTATTEARANVKTVLAAMQAGAPDQAIKLLGLYARALPPGKQYASPAQGSQVVKQLTEELQAAYRQMPKAMQTKFDEAVQAAKKANPSAWVSHLRLSK